LVHDSSLNPLIGFILIEQIQMKGESLWKTK